MQLEKPKDRSVGLALFLRSSLRITDRRLLEELLMRSNARGLVHSTSYQDIFILIKTVGLADSLELLPLTSDEQRCGFIDLDCWRKDSFHLPRFMEWLAAFIHCGPEETVRMARAVDANVLSLFLKYSIQVHFMDPEEPRPDVALFLTPDDRFGIEITGEGESAPMARLLLDALFRFDPSLGYDLIDRVYWKNRVSLEEEAYQDKRRRLEQIGFVDYYDALEIYGEDHTQVHLKYRPPADNELTVSSTLAAMLVASLPSGHYLREALQTVQTTEEAETISQGLAALANRLLSVYSVTPGDLEKVEPALEEMRDTLNLSLEYLTQGQDSLAGGIFQRYDVQGLFKIGFNLVSQLRDQADRIFRRGNLRLERAEDTILEFPEAEFYAGIKRLRPLFFEGIEDPSKATYRHFQSLADLELAKKLLDQIDVISAAFWQMLGTSAGEFLVGQSTLFNLSRKELRFSQIFSTAVINYLTGGVFVPLALSQKELSEFLGDWEGFDLNRLTKLLVSAAERQVETAMDDSEQSAVASQFAKRWVTACAQELFPLIGKKQIDPRFIRSLLLRLG
jgi:uncharacterized protein DUF6178